ncbi:trehalose transporter 1-like protein isoform X1 [Lycorma delicatula]|uniref:trehalose transporter 1-like protein isoform X1 n=1 Tax=Lycorma delicatula TaxID=130591 RepID=UPI003F51AA22
MTTTSLKPEETKTLNGDANNGKAAVQQELATEIAASYFDISFQPTAQVTYKSVLPQENEDSKDTSTAFPRNSMPIILACIAAASFHFPVGIVVAFSAILIPKLEAPDSDIKVTKEETSWIASLVVLVVPVGALMTGYLVDKIGRLNTIKLCAIPYIIGWILIANAVNLPMILVGRFLTGFALAMGPSPAVVYITEVARPDLRGALICTGPSMTSLGMVFVYTKGAFLHWRTVAWISVFYCLIPILLMILWSPESPAWLLSKGRTEDALKSLVFLARNETQGGLPEQQLAQLQKDQFSKNKDQKKSCAVTKLIRSFFTPNGYKPFFILFFLFLFQQFSGIYITIFYAVTFFQEVGAGFNAYLSTIYIGIVRMLVGLLTTFLLRRFGRRPLFVFSGLGMAISMAISGYYTRLISTGQLDKSLIPIICILLFMSFSVTGLMTIPWTMTAELYPLEIRGLAQGLTISTAHLIMFSAIQCYRPMSDWLGGSYAVQWLFGFVSLLSVIFVFIFLPETHKKLLSEIQDYFKHNTIYLLRNKTGSQAVSNNNQNAIV